MFHKTVHNAWNLFNLSEQSLEKFYRKFSFWVSIDREVLRLIERYFRSIKYSFRLIEQESTSDWTRQKLQDFFFTISIDQAKTSTDQKCLIQNFHLENSRTWIFTLWNNILYDDAEKLTVSHTFLTCSKQHLHNKKRRSHKEHWCSAGQVPSEGQVRTSHNFRVSEWSKLCVL